MKKKLKRLILGSIFLAGCQAMPYKPYARKVKVKPKEGGVVALKLQHNQEDRAYADTMMSGTCKGLGIDIVEEGEVVIGTETASTETHKAGEEGTKIGSLWGVPLTTSGSDPSKTSSSTTLQKKEWQIKYKCSSVAGSARDKKTLR